MSLLGRWNWWLPGWLDRLLPRIDAELPRPAAGSAPVETPPAPPYDERPLVDA